MTALPSKRSSGCHMTTEEEDHQITPGRDIWRRRCGQQDTNIQLEEEWEDRDGSTGESSRCKQMGCVASALPRVTRLGQLSQVKSTNNY